MSFFCYYFEIVRNQLSVIDKALISQRVYVISLCLLENICKTIYRTIRCGRQR